MSNRNDETNDGGTVTKSGGNMPSGNSTNKHSQLSRVSGKVATPVVVANNHAVEVDGDGGIWDTVASVTVSRDKTNLDSINL